MPYAAGVYTVPPGTEATTLSPIDSSDYNAFVADIEQAQNAARPISAGGTGGVTAAEARTNLGLSDTSAVSLAFTAASASGPASLDFLEDTDNGTNKITLKGQSALAGDQVLTLPDATDTLVGLAAIQTLTNKTLTTPTLTLKQSATPTPTAEGDIQWDTDDNVLVIGDGAATKIFVALPSGAAAGDMLYLSAAKVLARVAIGTAGQLWTVNAGATAGGWAAPVSASMTLLGTLTTTSGATQSLTSIPAGYRYLHIEIDGVSFANNTIALNVAVSSTNGAAYGTAGAVAVSQNNGDLLYGVVRINNVGSAVAAAKVASSALVLGSGTDKSVVAVAAPTNTAAVVDAIQFSCPGSTFDAGTIRVYGVK